MRIFAIKNKINIPSKKCDHRFGAEMTFSHQTDSRYKSSIFAAELYGFKSNIRLGAYITNLLGHYSVGIADVEATGLMRHDIYYGSDFWENPVTGEFQTMPDYYATAWTSIGASYFNITDGDTKLIRHPNTVKELYDLSDGAYGYETLTNTMGASNLAEFFNVIDYQRSWLKGLTGRNIAAAAYRNNVHMGGEWHLTKWLGIRNTDSTSIQNYAGGGQTFYGYDSEGDMLGDNKSYDVSPNNRTSFHSIPSTYRWWDAWNTGSYSKESATTALKSIFQTALSVNGWYKDFTHWHSCRNNGTMGSVGEFLQIVRSEIGSKFVWTCSMGEALEYLYIRDLTSATNAFINEGKLYVTADIQDKYKGDIINGIPQDVPLECLETPLSVEVDLTGTVFESINLVSSFSKIKRNGSKIIVEVPFNDKEGFSVVEISEGEGGEFITSVPTATILLEGDIITVTTSVPTKSVLYGVVSGGNDYDSLPIGRTLTFETVHSYIIEEGVDYRVGIISEFGMASLITV